MININFSINNIFLELQIYVKYLFTSILSLRLYIDLHNYHFTVSREMNPNTTEANSQTAAHINDVKIRSHEFNFQISISVILLSLNLPPHLHDSMTDNNALINQESMN